MANAIDDLRWPAPAKLNLMLRITGRRSDGYHELQSVFQFLDLKDELQFQRRSDKAISCSKLDGVRAEQNLVLQAANLLQSATNTAYGAQITLHKQLPMGGGLGGGSSDAATTLLALNQLWQTGLTRKQLADLGLQLGADVPVFIYGNAAWVEGIGEAITPLPALPEPWFLLLDPGAHVSTAEIFCDSRLTRDAEIITIRDFLAGQHDNVCLPVTRRRHSQVGKTVDWLNQFAEARLTGTGGCVFAAFATRQEAAALLQKTPQGVTGYVARGLNQSPVNDLLKTL